MQKSIPYYQMAGFIFTSVLGTLLHFLFDWTGGNAIAALFSAVNESIWEHMKLLFYPMILFAFVEFFTWGRRFGSFWCIKLIGILLGILLIPQLYYSYTGILGVSADWFNIGIFFIVAAIVFRLETKLFQSGLTCRIPATVSLMLILLIAVLFTVFTFSPPRIPLFRDPVTGTYGFAKIQ